MGAGRESATVIARRSIVIPRKGTPEDNHSVSQWIRYSRVTRPPEKRRKTGPLAVCGFCKRADGGCFRVAILGERMSRDSMPGRLYIAHPDSVTRASAGGRVCANRGIRRAQERSDNSEQERTQEPHVVL